MNIFRQYQERVREVLTRMMEEGALPAGLDLSRVVVEPPRDTAHGELSSNAAMVLAKQAGKPPREIAQGLMARLAKFEQVRDLSIAGPGFLNWRLDPAIWRGELVEVLRGSDAPDQARAF